ncbi:hypothetical protein D3C86_1256820 [compost metagenome]
MLSPVQKLVAVARSPSPFQLVVPVPAKVVMVPKEGFELVRLKDTVTELVPAASVMPLAEPVATTDVPSLRLTSNA